ncbi:MAG: pyruvate kinase, partial [Bacteroidales bacterium]|nr:pyruvate kinase [Bacteroidales bacterium]
MSKQTKIVATISDKCCESEFLQALFDAGMNVVRLNSAHLDETGLLKIIKNVRKVSNEIAILIDTKGPEIRTSHTNEPIELEAGKTIYVKGGTEESTRECIYVSYLNFVEELSIG